MEAHAMESKFLNNEQGPINELSEVYIETMHRLFDLMDVEQCLAPPGYVWPIRGTKNCVLWVVNSQIYVICNWLSTIYLAI